MIFGQNTPKLEWLPYYEMNRAALTRVIVAII